MHEGAFRFVADTVRRLEPRGSVVELGARTVAGDWPYSGPVRPLFNGADYVGVDIAHGPNVDVVGNAATYRPRSFLDSGNVAYRPVDTVVCCETLEHAPEADAICANAWKLLHPGGVFICTAAGEGRAPHSAVDGGPLRDGEFYRNVSREELRDWLKPFGFAMIDTFTTPGDIYALAVR
jgi:SAM-dependent methyltransferase